MHNRIKVYLMNKTMKEVDQTSLARISEELFATRDDIVKVEFPEGVEVLAEYAFEECTNLEEVICPKSLKKIEHHAFADCVNLKSVVYGEGVDVDEDAFCGCISMK